MNKKTLLFGAISLLIMFAVLPAANAVVLDPSGCPSGNSTAVRNLYAQYNSTYQTCMNSHEGSGLIGISLSKKYNMHIGYVEALLEKRPVSNLTWNEAYDLAGLYSTSKNEGRNIEYLSRYHKDLQYAKQMINARNTTQSRALAYLTMAMATQFRTNSGMQGSDVWMQRALPFDMKFIENDPSGMINSGDGDSNVSYWGDIFDLRDLKIDGYKYSNKAVAFEGKALTAAEAGKLNTPAELRNIGFYQWEKQDIVPLVHEKGPETIPDKISNIINTHVSGILPFYLKYGNTIFKGIGILLILSIVLLVVKRRRNRYY